MNKEILEIAKEFHDTYEKLASEYTYETREDTKVFDINSNNGKLMYATVNEIVSPILKENLELKKQLENCYCNRTDCAGRIKDSKKYDSLVQVQETQQKEFINYLEDEIKERKIQILGYHPTTQLLIEQIIETEKMVLSKYKEIIGDDK